jgi:hypothetical protein
MSVTPGCASGKWRVMIIRGKQNQSSPTKVRLNHRFLCIVAPSRCWTYTQYKKNPDLGAAALPTCLNPLALSFISDTKRTNCTNYRESMRKKLKRHAEIMRHADIHPCISLTLVCANNNQRMNDFSIGLLSFLPNHRIPPCVCRRIGKKARKTHTHIIIHRNVVNSRWWTSSCGLSIVDHLDVRW